MLQNLEILKGFEGDIIDPSFLFENDVINVIDYEISDPKKYSWFKSFDQIDINRIMASFDPTFQHTFRVSLMIAVCLFS